MINRDLILEFATEAHKGQVRKNSGEPYITHPIAVADLACELAQTDYPEGQLLTYIAKERLWATGILHDVPEDCDIKLDDIKILLLEAGFSPRTTSSILDDIELLTKREGYDIIEYLSDIKQSPIARYVKLGDLSHNMSDLKAGNLLDKYKLCKAFLEHFCECDCYA